MRVPAEPVLAAAAAAAALGAALLPLRRFLGLAGAQVDLRLWAPIRLPLDGPALAAILMGVFLLAGAWGHLCRARRLWLAAGAAVTAALVSFDPQLPARVLAALPGVLAEMAGWLRAFWFGAAEPPSPAAGSLLFLMTAWIYARGMWRVLRGRATWHLWFALGSLPALVLWLYGEPGQARGSLGAFAAAMLVLAPLLGDAEPGDPAPERAAGGWIRLAAGAVTAGLVLAAAWSLPALGARPMPFLHEGVQRLLPMTARGPGAGFGFYTGDGGPTAPLTLGGPFRPTERRLLTLTVSAADPEALPPTLYLRGPVRPVYTGRTLEMAPVSRVSSGLYQVDLPPGLHTVRVEQQVRLEDLRTPVVYAAFAARDVRLPGSSEPRHDAEGTLYAGPGLRPGETYTVVSTVPVLSAANVRALSRPPTEAIPADIAAAYLSLPDTVPERVRGLARQIAGTTTSPYEAAKRIEGFLRRLRYHEDTPYTPPGRDFVDYFLFDLRAGYCTYFTSAMVVMLREVGIPARAVEGFIVRLNGAGTYQVTGAQAHTWVEAYIPGFGWLAFEPTPAYPAATPLREPLPDQRALEDDLADSGLLDPAAPLPGLLPSPDPGLEAGLDVPPPGAAGRPAALAPALALAAVSVLAAGGLLLARRRAALRGVAPAERIAARYLSARRLLVRAALLRPGGGRELEPASAQTLTPAEFTDRLGQVLPAVAEPLQELTRLYAQAVYAPPHRRPGPAGAEAAEEALRSLLKRLRGEIGTLRYLAALLLPAGAFERPGAGRRRGRRDARRPPDQPRWSMGTYSARSGPM